MCQMGERPPLESLEPDPVSPEEGPNQEDCAELRKNQYQMQMEMIIEDMKVKVEEFKEVVK